jgi:plasmid stabilization system protein ParE
MFEVVFSKKANETFGFIQSQLLERWGADIVIKFEQRTMLVIETISNLPYIYQCIEMDPEVRKALIHKNCSLFYRIKGQKIVILFFWDNRQDPIWL